MSKPIPVTLDEDLLQDLKDAAEADGRSVSNLVRKWVREELAKSK
jgi:metal-responsive CopG/Arc/MetJ family transcriptional regulator